MKKGNKRAAANAHEPDGEDLTLLAEAPLVQGGERKAKEPNAMLAKMRKISEERSKDVIVPSLGGNGRGGNMLSASGIITMYKTDVMRHKKGGVEIATPKEIMMVALTHVNGRSAVDVIDTGIPGFTFLLPTEQTEKKKMNGIDEMDTSPEASTKVTTSRQGESEETKRRCVMFGEGTQKVMWAGMLRIDQPINVAKNKALGLGMAVDISGIQANFSKNSPSNGLFTNIMNARARASSPAPGEPFAEFVINEFMHPKVLESSAMLHSHANHGFFDYKAASQVQEAQVAWFQERWKLLVNGASSKCNDKANSINLEFPVTDAKMQAVACALREKASDIKGVDSSEVASGALQLFKPHYVGNLDNNPASAMYAPLVQIGKSPLEEEHQLVADAVDAICSGVPKGPNTFVALNIKQVIPNPSSDLVFHCYGCLEFMGDLARAIADCKTFGFEDSPILNNNMKPCIGFKVSMRQFAPKTLGTTAKEKAHLFMVDVMKYATLAVVAAVTPKAPDDEQVFDYFPSAQFVDMPTTLLNCGVRISEEFLISAMKLQVDNPQIAIDLEEVVGVIEQIPPKDETNPLPSERPSLLKTGYVAITEPGSFKFYKAQLPAKKQKRVYSAIFPGSTKHVAASNDHTCTAEGDGAITTAAEIANMPIDDYLQKVALVYCVAVA